MCPPKNTFTNLNYDLMAVGNMTINNPDLLLDNLKRKILDTEFSQAWRLYFDEKNGLRNWYQGHSREEDPLVSMWTKKQTISTSALSGVISTPSFRKPFDKAIFRNPIRRDEVYNFTVVIDFSGLTVRNEQWNKLLLDIETEQTYGKEQIYICGSKLWNSEHISEHIKVKLQCPSRRCNEATFWTHGQCSRGKVEVTFSRYKLDASELEVKKLQTMTGMRVAWNYTQGVTASEPKFLTENGQFIQLADLCCSYGPENQEQVWEVVKEAKFKWQFDTGSGYTALNILDRVEEQLGTLNLTQSDSCGEAGIRDEDLEAAARMHVYTFTKNINTNTNTWNQVIHLFSQERTRSPRFLLLLFGNMKPTNHFEESLKTIAMDTLSQHLGLQFGYIDDVAFMNVSEERREKIVGEKCIGFYTNKYKRHK